MTDSMVSFVPPIDYVIGKYEDLGFRVASLHEPLKRSIQQVIAPSIGENFLVGGRPTWEALKPGTIMQRAYQKVGGSKPLSRKGLLARAAQQLNIWTIDVDKAYVADMSVAQGGRAWYGNAQQRGYVGGFGAVTPARPFLMIR